MILGIISKMVLEAIPEKPNATSRRNLARRLKITEDSLDSALIELRRRSLIDSRELTHKEQRVGRFIDKTAKRGYYKRVK